MKDNLLFERNKNINNFSQLKCVNNVTRLFSNYKTSQNRIRNVITPPATLKFDCGLCSHNIRNDMLTKKQIITGINNKRKNKTNNLILSIWRR